MSNCCGACCYWRPTDYDDNLGVCDLISDWAQFEPEPADWPKTDNAWLLPFAGADGAMLLTSRTFGCTDWQEAVTPSDERSV